MKLLIFLCSFSMAYGQIGGRIIGPSGTGSVGTGVATQAAIYTAPHAIAGTPAITVVNSGANVVVTGNEDNGPYFANMTLVSNNAAVDLQGCYAIAVDGTGTNQTDFCGNADGSGTVYVQTASNSGTQQKWDPDNHLVSILPIPGNTDMTVEAEVLVESGNTDPSQTNVQVRSQADHVTGLGTANVDLSGRLPGFATAGGFQIGHTFNVNTGTGAMTGETLYAYAFPSAAISEPGGNIWIYDPVSWPNQFQTGTGKGLKVNGFTASAALDFPSINDGTCEDLTMTLTGAVAGDKISPGWPTAVTAQAGLSGLMAVSAADTVLVRTCNNSGAAVNLPSATFKAVLIK